MLYRVHPSCGYIIVKGIAQRTNLAHCTILPVTETLSSAVVLG